MGNQSAKSRYEQLQEWLKTTESYKQDQERKRLAKKNNYKRIK